MKVLQILPSEVPSETGECVPMFAFREIDSPLMPITLSAHSTIAELELAIPPQLLRKGKWSPEEEQYTLKLMELFKEGVVDSIPGISLRIYLAKKLNCEPMRITKKYAGTYAVGKIVFLPQHGKLATSEALQEQMKVLERLEEKFVATLNQYAMMESAINMTTKSRRKPSEAVMVGSGKKSKPNLNPLAVEPKPAAPGLELEYLQPQSAALDTCLNKGTEPENEPKDVDSSQSKGRAWQSYLFKVSPK